MPSLLFSSPDGFSSIELADCLFWWAGVVVEGVVRVVRRVEVVVGLAGGLLRELVAACRVVDEVAVVVGRVPVDSLGATDLVGGLAGGFDRDFRVEDSSVAAARAEDLSILERPWNRQPAAGIGNSR